MNWIKLLGPTIVKNVLNGLNAEETGKTAAKAVDEVFDDMFGDLKSEQIQAAIIPWLDMFINAFEKELLGDAAGQ